MKTSFTCDCCKQTKTSTSDFTTGYGTDPKTGEKFCYDCIGVKDKADFDSLNLGEKTMLYLSEEGNGYKLSNWPNSFSIDVPNVKKGGHNMAGVRYDTWFTFNGKFFHGVQ